MGPEVNVAHALATKSLTGQSIKVKDIVVGLLKA